MRWPFGVRALKGVHQRFFVPPKATFGGSILAFLTMTESHFAKTPLFLGENGFVRSNAMATRRVLFYACKTRSWGRAVLLGEIKESIAHD